METERQDTEIERRWTTVINDYNLMSAKISDLSRYVGFSLAGTSIYFLMSDSSFAKYVVSHQYYRYGLLLTSFLGCLVIALDYAQYYAGLKLSETAFHNVDLKNEGGDFVALINHSSKLSMRRIRAFEWKSRVAFCGALVFIGLLILATISYRPS